MEFVLTPDQMRKADAEAINKYNIPSIVLMENAARSAAEYIIDILTEDNDLLNLDMLIICGSGNNGGDGYAIARHLHEIYDVRVCWIGKKERMSSETESNFLAVEKLGIQIDHIENEDDLAEYDFEADCIVDAMIGVGGSENIKGLAGEILKIVRDIDTMKIAVDAPTGLNTVTGKAGNDCFVADFTITMFANKTGMLLEDGIDVCGEIFTAYLGAPEHIIEKLAEVYIIEDEDLSLFLPGRASRTSKFDYGRVLVVAGSNKFPGAAALCANAAILSGAGLVQLYSTMLHPSLMPEVISNILPANEFGGLKLDSLDIILKDAEKANVIVIGPGLGESEETLNLVKEIIKNVSENTSFLIDADALKAISKDDKLRKNIVLTPHTGEFSKLTGISREEVVMNSSELAKEWANTLNCIILLKHVPTIITEGKVSYWNINGNPGMASGGSGDVLSGLIAGLMAQGIEPFHAAGLGAFIHADAGDSYADDFSEETLTASSLLTYVQEALAIDQ